MARLLGIVVVLALIAAGVLWGMGALKFGDGKVTLDVQKAEEGGLGVYQRAYASFQGLQYKKAYEMYAQALKEHPDDSETPTAMFCMAKCLKEMQRNKEAVEMYRSFAEKYPEDKRAGAARKEADALALLGG